MAVLYCGYYTWDSLLRSEWGPPVLMWYEMFSIAVKSGRQSFNLSSGVVLLILMNPWVGYGQGVSQKRAEARKILEQANQFALKNSYRSDFVLGDIARAQAAAGDASAALQTVNNIRGVDTKPHALLEIVNIQTQAKDFKAAMQSADLIGPAGFAARGLRVSLIKHAHHAFDVDQPGKDSYRHRHAGASEVMVTSSRRWVLMHELRGAPEPTFQEQARRLSPCDLLLVEGFKYAAIPKLEVWRAQTGEALLHPSDPHIVAVATDRPIETRLPWLDLNDVEGIAGFVLNHLELA